MSYASKSESKNESKYKTKLLIYFVKIHEEESIKDSYIIVDITESDWILDTFRRSRVYSGGIDKYLEAYAHVEEQVSLVDLKKLAVQLQLRGDPMRELKETKRYYYD